MTTGKTAADDHRSSKNLFTGPPTIFRSAISLFRIRKAVASIRIGLDTSSECARMISTPVSKRLETVPIDHMNLRAAAKLTGKFLEGWLEIVFAKENAGQL